MRAALILVLAALSTQQHEAPRLGSVAWLAGCWEARSPRRVITEHWMAPEGDAMIAMSRTLRGDSLVGFELLVLRELSSHLQLEAHPSGQAPARFTADEVQDSLVVFVNPAHDFPQAISYRLTPGDTLLATAEGASDGRRRRFDVPYRRVPCPPGS